MRQRRAPREQAEQGGHGPAAQPLGGESEHVARPLAGAAEHIAPQHLGEGQPQGNGDQLPAPAPAPQRRARVGAGVPRSVPWGQGRDGEPLFVLARTHDGGYLKAITVTCNLHRTGGRCNKSLSLGVHFTEEEATHRIKEWCVRGMVIPESEGAKQAHMDPAFCNPRFLGVEDLRSLAELDAAVERHE